MPPIHMLGGQSMPMTPGMAEMAGFPASPAMSGPTMADPMTGMTMPDPIALSEPLPDAPPDEEETYGPTPPIWYRKPAKPKLNEVLEDAEREKGLHEKRIRMAMESLSRLNLEGFGMFERDKEKIVSGSYEGYIDTSLRDEHDAAVAYIAGMDWSAESPYRETIDQEEADAKEDLISYLFEVWERQHERAGNASLKMAIPDTLMKYGMLVGHAVVDPGDDECGIRMRLLDPATCYPIHEGHRGLGVMYRIYNASASQVIGDFGDAEGKVERKVRKIVGAKSNNGTFDRSWEGEVVEYWDRNWLLIAFEGEQILIREHGYACCPFVVTFGGFGQQNFTSSRSIYVQGEGTTWNRPDGTLEGFNPKADDYGRIAAPFLARRWRPHDINEAVYGRLLTMYRMGMRWPLYIKQSVMSAEMNDIEIDYEEEGQTFIGPDDEILPLPNLPTPEVVAALMQVIAEGKQTSMATGLMMGQSPHSQASGSAIDILMQTGFARWSTVVVGAQCFIELMMELILALYRDWGLILGMEPNIGTLYVPRRNPNPRTGGAPVHEVTPDLLRRTGIRCIVNMFKFNPANAAALAQAQAIWKSMGILPKQLAVKMAAFSPNPQGVLRQVDEEQLADVPEVKQERTLSSLIKEAEDAALRGDMESAKERMGKAVFIASMMQRNQMIGQPGGGGGMPPGMPPTIPGTPPVDLGRNPSTGQPTPMPPPGTAPQYAIPEMAVQGLSMPQMGVPVGTQGGRRPGS